MKRSLVKEVARDHISRIISTYVAFTKATNDLAVSATKGFAHLSKLFAEEKDDEIAVLVGAAVEGLVLGGLREGRKAAREIEEMEAEKKEAMVA